MQNTLAKSIKENHKLEKDFMIHNLLTSFKHRDRMIIAKLMKENYKEGFLNGMKIKQ